MSIQNILYRKGDKVITIRATDTVATAVNWMRARGVAALAVKNGDAINGLISERNS
jgi:predicted transcriptional regulator